MKNISIFSLSYPKGTEREIKTQDGAKQSQICIGDIGLVSGTAMGMRALVLEGYTDSDLWYLVNLCDTQCIYLGTVAILGATGSDHAKHVALQAFNPDFGNIAQVYDVVEASGHVLNRLLSNESRARFNSRITYDEIYRIQNQLTFKPVVWGEQSSVEPVSHGSIQALVSDMVRFDDMREMQQKVITEEMANKIMQDAETAQYDAIISQVSRLDGLSNRILLAMGKAADKVKPVNVSKTDPFKKHGVVNVAQIFEMDDGQTVTIIYHNPDATPKRLDASDVLTSWKFMLNNRDVSAVLQPKSGKDVNIADLAKRIMKIVEANSARFKRTQERKLKAENALNELQKIEQEKRDLIRQLDEEIADLQRQLDVPIAQTGAAVAKVDQPLPDSMNVNADGDILNKQGKPFLTRNVAQRFITTNQLTGYVPMKTDDGYVLHKLNDPHYKQTGKIVVGNPIYTEMVLEGEPKLIFHKYGRTFYVVDSIGGSGQRFEVVEGKSRMSVPAKDGDGKDIFFFSSLTSAYSMVMANLENLGESGFNKSGMAKAEESDPVTASLILQGEMPQPIDAIKQKQEQKAAEKKKTLDEQLDALRDEKGKLNPFSDNPMERVRAVSEMTFPERLAHEEANMKFLTKSDEVDKAELARRELQLIASEAGNPDSPYHKMASEMLLERYKQQVEEFKDDPESTSYKVAIERVQRLEKSMQEKGYMQESKTPAAEPSRYNIISSNPRARKPEGFFRLTLRTDGNYDVHLEQGTVGGDFVGDIGAVKSWLTGRLQKLGEAMSGTSSWEKITQRLKLVSGGDVLGLNTQPEPKVTPVEQTAEQGKERYQFGLDTNKALQSAFDDGVPKISRKLDGVIHIAKQYAKLHNGIYADVVADELQHVLNQNRQLRQYEFVVPKLDNMTRKMAVKLRRLNKALKEAGAPVQLMAKDDDNVKMGPTAEGRRDFTGIELFRGKDNQLIPRGTGKEYGELLPAVLAYLNDDNAIQHKHIFFGRNPQSIDPATNQLNPELRQEILEGFEVAKAKQAEYAANRKSEVALEAAKAAASMVQDLDPSLGAVSEVKDVAQAAGLTDTVPTDAGNTPSNPDEAGPQSISRDDEARLMQELKRLNQDPDFGGNDRYTYFARRIQRAADGVDQEAFEWAQNWLSELDQEKADKQQEIIDLKERRAQMETIDRYKFWEQAKALGDDDLYTSWISSRTSEFVAKNPEYRNYLGGTPSQVKEYQAAFDEFLKDYLSGLESNVSANPDEAWLDQIIDGAVDLANLNMDDFEAVAVKYADDTNSPVYAKLEQALTAITNAKMAKAKGVAA